MNIKSKAVAVALALSFFAVPGVAMAQTQSLADLQAEVQSLLAQVQQLESQLNAKEGGVSWCYNFNSNLSIGMSGADVTALQTALQKDGESVNVTGTFDDQTASAVSGFQQKYADNILTPNGLQYGTGYAGPSTRGKLNSTYGCGNTASSSTSSSSSVSSTTQSPTSPVTGTGPYPVGTPQNPAQTVTGGQSGQSLSCPETQAQDLALLEQLQALQNQPATSETQTESNTISLQLKSLNSPSCPVPPLSSVNTSSGEATSVITTTPTAAYPTTSATSAEIQEQIQALEAEISALQSQPSTPAIQAEINANLQQISSLQSQLSTGTTVTGVTTPTQTTVIQPSTPVTVTNEGGSRASVSFSGYTWTPISVSYGSLSSFGDWYVDPSTNFLHEDAISPLHYKVVASMLPASDVDVQATVSMEQGTEMGVCARMDAAGNGYCFATSWGGGTYPQIGKFSNGDQNPMGIASAQTPSPITPNTNYIVELRVQGSSISGRIYQAGTTAPTAWTAQTTDNSFTSGAVGFYSYGSQPVIKSVTVTQLMNTSTSSASSTASSSGTTTAE